MSLQEKVTADRDVKTGSWRRPEMRDAGNLRNVLQGGTGKLSPTQDDTGDNRKPKGQG